MRQADIEQLWPKPGGVGREREPVTECTVGASMHLSRRCDTLCRGQFALHGVDPLIFLEAGRGTIPIVFNVVNDPVGQGFVASLSRPGGNITGFTFIDFPLIGKKSCWRHCRRSRCLERDPETRRRIAIRRLEPRSRQPGDSIALDQAVR
jgi:hypothetical protein